MREDRNTGLMIVRERSTVDEKENIGIIAVKMLMQKILEETELHSEILLKPNIIKRDSIKVLTDRK